MYVYIYVHILYIYVCVYIDTEAVRGHVLLPGGICCCIYAGSGLEVFHVDDDDGDDGDENDCSHGDGDDDGDDDDGGDGGVDDGDGEKTVNGKQAMVKQVYIPSLSSLHPKASKIPITNPRNGSLISYVQSLQVPRNPKPSTSSAKNL